MANSIIKGYQLESAKSLATSFTSDPVNIRTLDYVVFNVATDSVTDNTGEFFVEHRVYKDDLNFSAWCELTLTPQAVLADADDNLTLILDPAPIGQVRVKFTAAGGTPDGTCDIWVTGASKGGRN